jgi:hypothetical protein
MASTEKPYASLRERVVGEAGVIMLVGGPDTGKTSLAKFLLRDGLARARKVAFVDADIGTSTVGPPACVGLKWIKSAHDFERLYEADELRFVGSTQPQGVILPHVVAAGALVDVARRSADFIVLDTTGMVQGVVGQTLKYHLMEACDPALVVAMQRGTEMEPTIGMLQRFLGARVARAGPLPDLVPLGPEEKRLAGGSRRMCSPRRCPRGSISRSWPECWSGSRMEPAVASGLECSNTKIMFSALPHTTASRWRGCDSGPSASISRRSRHPR